MGSGIVTLALFLVVVIVIAKAIRIVPQQHALVIERWGRFHGVLAPGLNFVVPFVDRVAYKHDLREIPFDVPSQICITKDNTQLQVDGILYVSTPDNAWAVGSAVLPGKGGVLLIVIGALFLLGNLDVFEIDRIARFWPAVLVVLGAWLLKKHHEKAG